MKSAALKNLLSLFLAGLASAGAAPTASETPLLFQTPTLSATQIAFCHAGLIWTVSRSGGDARRLVDSGGRNGGPIFSPDGSKIAFTSFQDGNADVYVVDAHGGKPVRLTYHPGFDGAVGWTPDGSRVVFMSDRITPRDLPQLFTVGLDGGLPRQIPLPSGTAASFSPDGSHLAYVPNNQWEPEWKMYRGGQTTPIWIADLADSSVVKVPRDNSNDRSPMWVGDTVYFLSDRDGRFTLFAFDTKSSKVRKVLGNDGLDIKSASAGPGAIVYSQFDSIHLLDLATGKSQVVPIRIAADLPQLNPRFEKVKPEQILGAAISPSGKRALIEAHGEILSVPAEKGDVRNLTQSPGVADRDPSWSPDGKTIAYFSDESGEYALHLRSQDGLGTPRKIDLGKPASFFYGPHWSPDSTKIAYTDKRMKVWYVSVDGGAPVSVDADLYDTPLVNLNLAWSPDSKWIAYTKQLPNHLRGVFVYSLADGHVHQVTDGLSDANSPRFDRDGKYLYFTASTETALSAGWLDMSSIGHPTTSNVYAAVLANDSPSPVAPESDEETAEADKAAADAKEKAKETASAKAATDEAAKAGAKDPEAKAVADAKGKNDAKDAPKAPEPVRIDFAGLDQRIVAMPFPAANYVDLQTGKEGILYIVFGPFVPDHDPNGWKATVSRFDRKTRKTDKVADGLSAFLLSANGEKMLILKDKKWLIQDADKEDNSGKGTLGMDRVEVYVDPRAEWRQIFHEAWRIERDFFYDPGHHGLDLAAAERLYEPYVDGIGSRGDLNALLGEMTGWMVSGHLWAAGGYEPESAQVSGGLLGADYAVENGRYRIARIYPGENWNPDLASPLTRPGVHAKEGDYVLAVNGHDVAGTDEIFRLFQSTAGKQTVVRIGPNADGSGAHDETVVPIPSESNLRYRAWIESNRKKVEELSAGRLAYVHLPDTGGGGFANFNRYYFAQVGKQGAILDERFNHGGDLADYIVDMLNRPVRMINASREGEDYAEPAEAIHGPKVMLINEMSGSGGDALPWMFRINKSGTLVGTRTWGGLIGISGYPALIDGGSITAPRWALYGTKGEWEVENHGVPPDVEVEMDPKLVRQGHDPQLERAVAIALEQLAKNPVPKYARPAYPNYHQKLPVPPATPAAPAGH
jgi:tricorn protease